MDSSDHWEAATLILKRTGYQIQIDKTQAVVVSEKYSNDLAVCFTFGALTCTLKQKKHNIVNFTLLTSQP